MCDIDVRWESCEKHKKLPPTHRVAALTVDQWRNVVLMKCHTAVSAQHPVTEFHHRAWCNALNHIKTMGAKKRTSQTPVCEKTYILHPSCSSFLCATNLGVRKNGYRRATALWKRSKQGNSPYGQRFQSRVCCHVCLVGFSWIQVHY